MLLQKTFPSRFGTFKYQFYESCDYRLYEAVSIEESNS
jgi:hypothetical protein